MNDDAEGDPARKKRKKCFREENFVQESTEEKKKTHKNEAQPCRKRNIREKMQENKEKERKKECLKNKLKASRGFK